MNLSDCGHVVQVAALTVASAELVSNASSSSSIITAQRQVYFIFLAAAQTVHIRPDFKCAKACTGGRTRQATARFENMTYPANAFRHTTGVALPYEVWFKPALSAQGRGTASALSSLESLLTLQGAYGQLHRSHLRPKALEKPELLTWYRHQSAWSHISDWSTAIKVAQTMTSAAPRSDRAAYWQVFDVATGWMRAQRWTGAVLLAHAV